MHPRAPRSSHFHFFTHSLFNTSSGIARSSTFQPNCSETLKSESYMGIRRGQLGILSQIGSDSLLQYFHTRTHNNYVHQDWAIAFANIFEYVLTSLDKICSIHSLYSSGQSCKMIQHLRSHDSWRTAWKIFVPQCTYQEMGRGRDRVNMQAD